MVHAGTIDTNGKIWVSINMEKSEVESIALAFQELAIRIQKFNSRDYNNIENTIKLRAITGKGLMFFSDLSRELCANRKG